MSAGVLLAASILALGLACRPDDSSPPRRAVLILLDAARADRFGSYGYPRDTTPHMDDLAARGLVVTHHFAQETHTRQSLPSLLYSRYFVNPIFPYDLRVPFADPKVLMRRNDDELFSLPRVLAQHGLKTAAISSHVWLKPGTRFAREFDQLFDISTLEGYDPKYAYPRGEQVMDHAIGWLKDHRRSDFFLYLHLMDTHFPHFFDADAQSFAAAEPIDANPFLHDGTPRDPAQPLSAAGRTYLDALYDGSLRYADRQVGRLVRFLERRGMLEDTLIVITSDHGEHLLETPGRFSHGGPWYENVARIPLIIFYPGRVSPGRMDSLTEAVDVSPTVLRLLGVPIPRGRKADGTDLLETSNGALLATEPATELATEPETEPVIEPDTEHVFMARGVRGPRYKCLFHDRPAILLAEEMPAIEQLSGELYDLAADAEERNNLWASDRSTVERLLKTYRRHMLGRYERAEAAVNHDPPDSPFAVTSSHFRTDLDVPKIAIDASVEAVRELETDNGWILLADWRRKLLIAKSTGEAFQVEFPLPNGEYHVIAQISGGCALEIPGVDARVELRGPTFDLADRMRADAAKVGSVTVSDEVFRATIHPSTAESWFAIQYLGFVPAGSDLPDMGEEQLERLKTLGYVD